MLQNWIFLNFFFHGAFATGVTSQQGTLTRPDTWFRPPFWDLLMLQLLRPNSSNLPCLYSTFHLEYPLVLSRFCFVEKLWQHCEECMCSLRNIAMRVWQTDGRTDRQTDDGQSDPNVSLCFASDTKLTQNSILSHKSQLCVTKFNFVSQNSNPCNKIQFWTQNF